MKHVMKKRFGQNFLTDKNLLEKIVREADLKHKNVIEIGPGQGALTQYILKDATKLTCYEIDKTLENDLFLKFSNFKNFNLIIGDFLEQHIILDEDHVLIGNIPYYITSPILFKFLEHEKITEATLMMQKEVGLRLIAKPQTKAYNGLSVIFQYYTHIKNIMEVKRHMFFPPPKVDSVVVKFVKKNGIVKNEFFENLVKIGFSNKRKMLINNLCEYFNRSKAELSDLLKSIDISPTARAEELSIEKWTLIAATFKTYM